MNMKISVVIFGILFLFSIKSMAQEYRLNGKKAKQITMEYYNGCFPFISGWAVGKYFVPKSPMRYRCTDYEINGKYYEEHGESYIMAYNDVNFDSISYKIYNDTITKKLIAKKEKELWEDRVLELEIHEVFLPSSFDGAFPLYGVRDDFQVSLNGGEYTFVSKDVAMLNYENPIPFVNNQAKNVIFLVNPIRSEHKFWGSDISKIVATLPKERITQKYKEMKKNQCGLMPIGVKF